MTAKKPAVAKKAPALKGVEITIPDTLGNDWHRYRHREVVNAALIDGDFYVGSKQGHAGDYAVITDGKLSISSEADLLAEYEEWAG